MSSGPSAETTQPTGPGFDIAGRQADPMAAHLARMSSAHPLIVLHSGRTHERWSRWSIVAEPAGWLIVDQSCRLSSYGEAPSLESHSDVDTGAHDPFALLDTVLAATRIDAEAVSLDATASADHDLPPFFGGWIGHLSYDLGRIIEPAVERAAAEHSKRAQSDRPWPLLALAWCPRAWIRDNRDDVWWQVEGDQDSAHIMRMSSAPDLNAGRRVDPSKGTAGSPDVQCGKIDASFTPAAYEAAVARAIEYIAAGDIFQANIAQRFTTPFIGSPRALAARAFQTVPSWYGGYVELPTGERIISMSPELFLSVDSRDRTVITRPIKGTRPDDSTAGELATSEKDTAELSMIVDLMRNDLGRVCEFGSVRVAAGRTIERHPTIVHGVGEVRGRLRAGVSMGDLLRATFPGGSVTGAPKIRAMQIIEELEPIRRGPYCGSLCMFDRRGNATLNIAIRTMLLSSDQGCLSEKSAHRNASEEGATQTMSPSPTTSNGDTVPSARQRDIERGDETFRGLLDYSAGCGIVADSDPHAEYLESLAKTRVFRDVIDCPSPSGKAPA